MCSAVNESISEKVNETISEKANGGMVKCRIGLGIDERKIKVEQSSYQSSLWTVYSFLIHYNRKHGII